MMTARIQPALQIDADDIHDDQCEHRVNQVRYLAEAQEIGQHRRSFPGVKGDG